MTGLLRQFLAAIISVAIASPLGAASSGYDPVGNRTQKTSTLPGMPGGLSNYNPSAPLRAGANDQLATDTYDADENTTASNGNGYAYDFENHLVQQGAITIVYDGHGSVRPTAPRISWVHM
jgi:hypothetical protein